MNFAIDFDNTITSDPALFRMFIHESQRRGHKCFIVTARMKTTSPEDLDPWRSLVDGVFFTEHKAKREFMKKQGIPISVWIDDSPDALVEDYDGPARTYREMEAN